MAAPPVRVEFWRFVELKAELVLLFLRLLELPVTIVSPSLRPLRITVEVSLLLPVVTTVCCGVPSFMTWTVAVPSVVVIAVVGTMSTSVSVFVMIVAETVMLGYIGRSVASITIVAGYEVTPELDEPETSTAKTLPVKVLPSWASIVIVTFCPAFTLVTSASVKLTLARYSLLAERMNPIVWLLAYVEPVEVL